MTGKTRKQSAFTLVELLVVVLIMSLLVALVSGGILASIRNARKRRNEVMISTLSSAIQNYRHEYGDWPYNPEDREILGLGDDCDDRCYYANSCLNDDSECNPFMGAEYIEDNYEVFNRLHPDHSKNPNEIRFLEEGRFLTVKDGDRMFLHEARSSDSASGEFPIVDPIDGRPYRVSFNFDDDTVSVKKQ